MHLELATDASTMELLHVLRRFFSYHGYPKQLILDNGSQMVGPERELCAMIEGWDIKQLKEYCADRGMIWQFTTPLAPHQNSCSESLVKSSKSALKKAIGETLLTPFELYTCLREVANHLNQRPIGRTLLHPDDGSNLCPNNILLGRARNTVPQGPFCDTLNPRHISLNFARESSILSVVGKRCLPHLVPRKKWNTSTCNVSVGDNVIIADPNSEGNGPLIIIII